MLKQIRSNHELNLHNKRQWRYPQIINTFFHLFFAKTKNQNTNESKLSWIELDKTKNLFTEYKKSINYND